MTPKSLGIWIKTEWIQWLNWRCLGWTEQRAVKIWPILWYPGHAGCSVTLIWAGRTGQLWIWKRHLTQLSQKLKEFSSKGKSVFWSSLQFLVSWLSSLLVRLFLDIFGNKKRIKHLTIFLRIGSFHFRPKIHNFEKFFAVFWFTVWKITPLCFVWIFTPKMALDVEVNWDIFEDLFKLTITALCNFTLVYLQSVIINPEKPWTEKWN